MGLHLLTYFRLVYLVAVAFIYFDLSITVFGNS